MGLEERRHFRIKYPPPDRPMLEIGGDRYSIMDISESGIKFVAKPPLKPVIKLAIKGKIVFADGASVPLEGSVVRVVGDLTMVTLRTTIPRDRLRIEADRLIARYGSVPTVDEHK